MTNQPSATQPRPRMTTREITCTTASFVIVIAIGLSADWLKNHLALWAFKIAGGFFLGTLGTISFMTLKDAVKRYKTEGLQVLGKNLWGRPFGALFYGLLGLAGLIAWLFDSGGVAEAPYALGVYVGTWLAAQGIVSALKRGV